MECCGRSGFTDYTFQGFFPPSCCRDTNNCRVETVNRRGCKQAFVEYWDRNSDIIKYTGLVIAAIEVSFEEPTSYQHELIPLTDCFFYLSVCGLHICLLFGKQHSKLQTPSRLLGWRALPTP